MVGPVTKLTFLGLELDAENQSISLPSDKVCKASQALTMLIHSNKIRLKQL